MKITRTYDEQLEIYNYRFEEGNISLLILYGANLDLYFSLHSSGVDINSNNCFNITKENMIIYDLFEKLFSDIKNVNIFNDESKTKKKWFDMSVYNNLYNPDTNTITWHSDETALEVANYLTITKEEEKFKLEFFTKPYIEGYCRDYHTKYRIPIRFRNSGTRYYPFNECFMKLYNDLQKYDPECHQITIDEYDYNNKKSLKLEYLPKQEIK
jgi:hypothetical protein